MQCPHCGSRSEVNEKRGPFRDRRCTNGTCGLDFTTREQVVSARAAGRVCARTRLRDFKTCVGLPPGAADAPPIPWAKARRRSGRVGRPRGAQKKPLLAVPGADLDAASTAFLDAGAPSGLAVGVGAGQEGPSYLQAGGSE